MGLLTTIAPPTAIPTNATTSTPDVDADEPVLEDSFQFILVGIVVVLLAFVVILKVKSPELCSEKEEEKAVVVKKAAPVKFRRGVAVPSGVLTRKRSRVGTPKPTARSSPFRATGGAAAASSMVETEPVDVPETTTREDPKSEEEHEEDEEDESRDEQEQAAASVVQIIVVRSDAEVFTMPAPKFFGEEMKAVHEHAKE